MYVIIGAGGFLGSYLIRSVLSKTTDRILAVDRVNTDIADDPRVEFLACDITDRQQILGLNDRMNREKEPCKVLCLAAYHHPDLVARNPKTAWNVNVVSLAFLLNSLENVECLFYPSTDTVYGEGGLEYRFKESDRLAPVNLYGKHKVVAETLVTTYGHHVVRFPFLIGPSLLKTRKHFYDEIADTITRGDTMKMYRDSYRSSLDFGTAALLLISLVEAVGKNAPPIVNLAGDQALSKYDIGLMIADLLNVPRDRIIPVSVADNTGIFGVPRAASTLLDNTLAKRLLKLSSINLSLEGYV